MAEVVAKSAIERRNHDQKCHMNATLSRVERDGGIAVLEGHYERLLGLLETRKRA